MAKKDRLKYGMNQFLTKTKKSMDKAVKLITYHAAQIAAALALSPADPDLIMMNTRTQAAATDATLKFTSFNSVEGAQAGASENVDNELALIQGADGSARDWYNRTAAIYAKTNKPRMKAIWSQKLKPFREKKDNVILALHTLSMNIGADANPLMIAIKAEVDAKYLILNPDRITQKSSFFNTSTSSKALKASCDSAMTIEYQNSGILMNKYPANVNYIQESFHDMELLLDKQQMVFNPTLNANETKDMAKRTLVFNSKFRCIATSGDVWVYLSSTVGGIDSTPVIVLNGIQNEFIASAFGITDYGLHCHITAVNQAGVKVSFLMQLY